MYLLNDGTGVVDEFLADRRKLRGVGFERIGRGRWQCVRPRSVRLAQQAAVCCSAGMSATASLVPVEISHSSIVPDSLYQVDVFDEGDPPVPAPAPSVPMMIATSLWGDLVGPFNPQTGQWGASDGAVNLTSDAVAMIETFQSASGFTRKVHIDVMPATPDGAVTVLDVVSVIDAFRGFDYPIEPGPVPCP